MNVPGRIQGEPEGQSRRRASLTRPQALALLLFFTLFKAAPNRKVSIGQALLATVIAAVFTVLGTQIYMWVIGHPGWGVVYGALARVMATFFLLYWECVILLGAAEISQIVHEWHKVARTMRSIR